MYVICQVFQCEIVMTIDQKRRFQNYQPLILMYRKKGDRGCSIIEENPNFRS